MANVQVQETAVKGEASENKTLDLIVEHQVLGTQDFKYITPFLNISQWPDIARNLNLTDMIIENIQEQYRHRDYQEQANQMLIRWHRRSGDLCTLQTLLNALKPDFTVAHDNIVKHFQNEQSSQR